MLSEICQPTAAGKGFLAKEETAHTIIQKSGIIAPLQLFGSEHDAEDFARIPETHARAPGAGSARNDDRHSAYDIFAGQQGIDQTGNVAERPELPAVSMTAEHQPDSGRRDLFGPMRPVGQKNSGAR